MSETTNLLELPAELLVEVGRHLERDDLLGLSLACRRLRLIGQEQLMRTAPVCPSRIWKLANTLRLRPDLAKVYTHLGIGRLGSDVYNVISDSLSEELGAEVDISSFVDIVSQRFPLFSIFENPNHITDVPSFIQFGVVVVLALSPSLCAMSMFTNVLTFAATMLGLCSDQDRSHEGPKEMWFDQVRAYVAKRLEEVVIVREKHVSEPIHRAGLATLEPWRQKQIQREVASFEMLLLDTSQFERLVTLQAPFSRLPKPILMMLPRTLKTLCIHGPGNILPSLRNAVDSLIAAAEQMPHLRLVELRFQYNMLSTAWSICRNESHGRNVLKKYRDWQSAPFRLITTFGNVKGYIGKRRNIFDTPSAFEEGDIVAALELCLTVPRNEVEQHPIIADALGYNDHNADIDAGLYGTNHRGPIILLGPDIPLS